MLEVFENVLVIFQKWNRAHSQHPPLRAPTSPSANSHPKRPSTHPLTLSNAVFVPSHPSPSSSSSNTPTILLTVSPSPSRVSPASYLPPSIPPYLFRFSFSSPLMHHLLLVHHLPVCLPLLPSHVLLARIPHTPRPPRCLPPFPLRPPLLHPSHLLNSIPLPRLRCPLKPRQAFRPTLLCQPLRCTEVTRIEALEHSEQSMTGH
ncbi:hypothetical protein Hypma_001639 [Hypsizygus marmoreus]|uniref:Uncharacterized protein n=1 Tax=Hypsizygus marmoreus TaxID=39966 RepID=A0A369J7P4_HYPMA|nr:hypothetical protein Hypma_001639 [Hypsizygus marmoreus]